MKSIQNTIEQNRLEVFLNLLAILFLLAALAYLFLLMNSFFIINSPVMFFILALMCFIAASDVKRFHVIIKVVITALVISVAAIGLMLLIGYTEGAVTIINPFNSSPLFTFSMNNFLLGSLIAEAVILVLLTWFYITAERAMYGLNYLTPMEFRSLTALADALIYGKDEKVQPEEIARNVDKYLNSFKARQKWIFKLDLIGMQIYPLLNLRPPLSYQSSEKRKKFLEKKFYKDVSIVPAFWRTIVKVMIRVAKQMSYLGYYNDERVAESIGYIPFSKRSDTKNKLYEHPPGQRRDLKVLTSPDFNGVEQISGDVIIIGSGAAGSILANKLAAQGREIIMIERGEHTDPSGMTENEIEMLSKLYSDGALQLSRDFQFQVLQGSCVGGTTVINNAVCFDLPADVFERWNDPQLYDSGLDKEKLFGESGSFSRIRTLLDIKNQKHNNLNKGAKPFEDGIKKLALNYPPNIFNTVDANILLDCYGCGYCNIGCRYGKKLSMLDSVLPMIQEKYPGALKIIAGCEANKIKVSGSKVKSVECTFKNGNKINIKGNSVIVSAGTISSSLLLLRSGINGQTGKNVSFNMGSPITAVFNEKINAYEGLQISHYIQLKPDPGFIIETWFNPPVAQALTMPGWFDDHFNNMLRYDRLSCAGILVPTQTNAEVRVAGLFGRDIKFIPEKNDLNKLLDGLITAGKIFFAGGAQVIMPHTWEYYEFKNEKELESLKEIVKKPGDITLGTGHPQGGNAISKSKKKGVINPEFKVFDYDNLYVCDASVFPSSIGVNPQLTVMALADYAGELIK